MNFPYTVDEVSAGPGTQSQGVSVNSIGDVCGLVFQPPGGARGAFWPLSSLGAPEEIEPESALYGANHSGDIVGVTGWDNTSTESALLRRGGIETRLDGIVGAGSIAVDINEAHLMVGSTQLGTGAARAFVLDANTLSGPSFVDPPSGTGSTSGQCINASGQIIGSWRDEEDRGFAIVQGAFVDLGPSWPLGLNDGGTVSGSLFRPWPVNFVPAIRSPSSQDWTEIPVPEGFIGAHGNAINAAGNVVGNCWTEANYGGPWSAYRYSSGVSTDLNTLIEPNLGWHLEYAGDINDSGQIVGTGRLHGRLTTFLLTPDDTRFNPNVWLFADILFGIIQDGGGLALCGNKPTPEPPWGPLIDRQLLTALEIDRLAQSFGDRRFSAEIRRQALTMAQRRVASLLTSLDMSSQAPREWSSTSVDAHPSTAPAAQARR
jgi:probable HAF family extracellular repeat protein